MKRDRTEADIAASLQRAQARVRKLEEKLSAVQGATIITCWHCNKKNPLSRWIFVVWHHYVRPHSCSNGDHWVRSEHMEELCCPSCGHGEYAGKFLPNKDRIPIAERLAGHLLYGYHPGWDSEQAVAYEVYR